MKKVRQWLYVWRVFGYVPWTSHHIGFVKKHRCIECDLKGWRVVLRLVPGRKRFCTGSTGGIGCPQRVDRSVEMCAFHRGER